MDIKEMKEALDAAAAEQKALIERQTDEINKLGEASKATEEALEKSAGQVEELKAAIEEKEQRIADLEVKTNRPEFGQKVETKSLGRIFVESEEFKGRQGYETPWLEVDKKAISNDAASAGDLLIPYYDQNIYKDPARTPRIKDLLPRIPVTGDSVTIFKRLVRTNAAAPQAGQNVAKAESGTTWDQENLSIQTIANYMVASRQILDDVSRLRGEIDADLVENLGDEMDDQILYGDGTGQNFTGLMVDSNVQDAGSPTAGLTGDALARAMLDLVRSAITKVQVANYRNINGVLLHPNDWQTLETAKGTDGHYIWANVQTGMRPMIWGVPVIVTSALTESEFILGDWTRGAKYYDREMVNIRLSESNGTDFIKNSVTILAEERGVLGITNPNALCKGDFTSPAS